MTRNHEGRVIGRGITDKESLRRNRGGGMMEEQSLRRKHGEKSGEHLGALWEASGMEFGVIWESFKNQLGLT